MNEAEKTVTETPRTVNLTPRQLANFWRKVDKSAGPDGCWIWKAYKDPNGYGRCGVADRKVALAHRVAYVLTNGEPPADKPFILHSCDTPSCTNPAHCFPGTQADNIADMQRKGRANQWARQSRLGDFCGVNNHQAKLNPDKVREIRSLRALGMRLIELSSKYGVSIAVIHAVASRRTWKQVA